MLVSNIVSLMSCIFFRGLDDQMELHIYTDTKEIL